MVSRGNFQMLLKDRQLRFAVAIQTNLANTKHIWPRQELGNHAHHFARKAVVFRFFGIDANPRVVRNTVRGGAARLAFGELAEIIMKSSGAAAIKARPKCGLGHGHTTRGGHARVVVRCATDHVNVWIDIHAVVLGSVWRVRPTRGFAVGVVDWLRGWITPIFQNAFGASGRSITRNFKR